MRVLEDDEERVWDLWWLFGSVFGRAKRIILRWFRGLRFGVEWSNKSDGKRARRGLACLK